MAGTISKADYLAAEKRFTQARTTVLQRVKAINGQIKNLTDLVRHDVPLAGERNPKPGRRSRNRSRSRSRSPRVTGASNVSTNQALTQAALLNTSRGLIGDHNIAQSFSNENIRFVPASNGLYVASANHGPSISQFLPIPNTGIIYPNSGGQFDPNVRSFPQSMSGSSSAFTNVNNLYAPAPVRAETRTTDSINSIMRVINERENRNRALRQTQEDQDAYFAREYGMESADMTNINFPEGWRYPDDRNFERYFEKMDYMKAKKAGTLQSFDGTIASYPDFRLAFYRQVHVQRGAVLEKITTLDSLMPSKFYKEHFKGLDLTIHDYKVRLERLERHFGGQKRQLEHLLSKIGEFLRDPSSHSTRDLQGFVYTIDNHFKKPSTHSSQKDVLATFLQVVLPDSTRLEYHQFLLKDKREDSPENFLDFLQQQLEAEIRNQQQKAVFNPSSKKGKAMTAMVGNGEEGEEEALEGHCLVNLNPSSSVVNCEYCHNKKHPLFRCFKFANTSYEDKIKYVKEKELCFKCLRSGHMVKECSLTIACEFCDSPYDTTHNRLLHKDQQKVAMTSYGMVMKSNRQRIGSRPFSSACVVLHLKCPQTGKVHAINALADTGASDFLIDTSVADRLKLRGSNCQFTVLGHGGHESVHNCITGGIKAINPETKAEYSMSYYAYDGPCEGMFPEDWSQLKYNWPHLKDLDIPSPVKGRHIEAIIGCKYLALFEPDNQETIYKGPNIDDPVAKKAPLGWVVAGKTSASAQGSAMNISGQFKGFAIVASGLMGDGLKSDYRQLYHQSKRDMNLAWSLETGEELKRLAGYYSPIPQTIMGERADVIFEETSVFTEQNRYQIGLIWSSDLRPENDYSAAKNQLQIGALIVLKDNRHSGNTGKWRALRHLSKWGSPLQKKL